MTWGARRKRNIRRTKMLWNEIALSNDGGTRMLPNSVTVTSSRAERTQGHVATLRLRVCFQVLPLLCLLSTVIFAVVWF